MKIIETSCNRFYRVEENADPRLAHCWTGVQMKRIRGGAFADKKNAKPELVRKAACRIVKDA